MERVINSDVVVQRLDDERFAFAIDGIVRYVGSQEDCVRRAAIRSRKNDRTTQDQALLRWINLSH